MSGISHATFRKYKIMASDHLNKYIGVIENAYKSLDHPDFAFVARAFEARRYESLMKRLRDYAAVEDLSASEDDVCFSYFLKGRTQLWKLDLSTVGPFGLLVRLKAALVEPEDFLHPNKHDLIAFERKVVDVLHGGGIRLMTVAELSLKVPLALFNTKQDEVTLYQALFSDRALAVKSHTTIE